jgi:predicted nucleotidyltransferase
MKKFQPFLRFILNLTISGLKKTRQLNSEIMQMNSKILQIKNKLKKYLKDKEILDVILFGSVIKGKRNPEDIDIAVVTQKDIHIDISGFHVSLLKPEDFFKQIPLVHTLLREGYSLKNEKPFCEMYRFFGKVLFKYELTSLTPSLKVKVVTFLRGKNNQKGMVEENSGKWLSNQVFLSPIDKDYLFEKFFLNLGVKFNKFFVLMH